MTANTQKPVWNVVTTWTIEPTEDPEEYYNQGIERLVAMYHSAIYKPDRIIMPAHGPMRLVFDAMRKRGLPVTPAIPA